MSYTTRSIWMNSFLAVTAECTEKLQPLCLNMQICTMLFYRIRESQLNSEQIEGFPDPASARFTGKNPEACAPQYNSVSHYPIFSKWTNHHYSATEQQMNKLLWSSQTRIQAFSRTAHRLSNLVSQQASWQGYTVPAFQELKQLKLCWQKLRSGKQTCWVPYCTQIQASNSLLSKTPDRESQRGLVLAVSI